jgi:hypothetical protein
MSGYVYIPESNQKIKMNEITATKVPSDESVNYILEKLIKSVSERAYMYKIRSIQKIQGIDIKLCIRLHSQKKPNESSADIYTSHFEILSRFGKYGSDEDYHDDILYISSMFKNSELNFECIRNVLQVIHERLPILKIDDNRNRLCLPRDEGFGTMYISGEECSMCMENTTCKTNCSHGICVVCWSILQNKNISFPCPMCRSIVEYKLECRAD